MAKVYWHKGNVYIFKLCLLTYLKRNLLTKNQQFKDKVTAKSPNIFSSSTVTISMLLKIIREDISIKQVSTSVFVLEQIMVCNLSKMMFSDSECTSLKMTFC